MAHYAFLDENNVVTEVITGIDETELIEGVDPETWYGNYRGQVCKRTSYNNNYRYNYAGQGFTFDESFGPDGAFIPPQPFPSWVLNSEAQWEAPIPEPDEDHLWQWDEDSNSWVLPT